MKYSGELSGDPFGAGTQIDREGCIIAATAIQENEPVLTTTLTSSGFRASISKRTDEPSGTYDYNQ